jgi:hypothetical protein
MGALNAAPNQNPFAFECNAHYRTARTIFWTIAKECQQSGCDN